jgi:CheY-like chemotaxis protein
VVALTSSTMKGDRERFLADGFDGYLGKPIGSGVPDRVGATCG